MTLPSRLVFLAVLSCAALTCHGADTPAVPEWAQPGSATHQQVPPPKEFRRASTHFPGPVGIFTGQSDIGSAVVPGHAVFDSAKQTYTIDSAGYNIWYHRDEFRYLWREASGDLSLAATIDFPKADGYFDRKAVLVIRQDLDDDAKEIMVALHGGGLIHLAQRPAKAADLKEDCRIEVKEVLAAGPGPRRLGIEKKGNTFRLWVSLNGEPMKPVGPAVDLAFTAPFYVGLGFTSHLPATVDTAVLSKVTLVERAGALH